MKPMLIDHIEKSRPLKGIDKKTSNHLETQEAWVTTKLFKQSFSHFILEIINNAKIMKFLLILLMDMALFHLVFLKCHHS